MPFADTPPRYVVEHAIGVSRYSPCRSKRGVVIFHHGLVIGTGWNHKPRGFTCDGSAACKATCRIEAVHAEQMALLMAADTALGIRGTELLHVKTVDGQAVPSNGPSCVQCSKLILFSGISGVWLLLANGWRRYDATDYHRLSLEKAR